jgi:nitroimidazol reductase NimA-like FMN-containing flavoprotein (pyridoxamine 5'-phosphate oxidase superfamily)
VVVARIPPELGLTSDELDELMTTSWNMRVATVGPAERINLTPLWFGWGGGRIYFYCRGQKIVNLRRNASCTILVDRNDRFPELQGAMFQGRATVLEDAAAEEADPHLERVRWQMGTKYAGGHGEASPTTGDQVRNAASARGRSWRWVAFQPDRAVTWDNHKLPAR